MGATAAEALAAHAAALVVDEGLDYAAARRKAARQQGASGREMPSDEQVEDAVREHLAIFHADTQPAELQALRELALHWMARLAEFHPHLGGAVWRGTATRLSAVRLDLYCDDPKAVEIELINRGLDYDVDEATDRRTGVPVSVLILDAPCRALGERIPVVLQVHDRDAQRGALKPDARGQSWRGDAAALQRRLAETTPEQSP
jgi:hypothetical protein